MLEITSKLERRVAEPTVIDIGLSPEDEVLLRIPILEPLEVIDPMLAEIVASLTEKRIPIDPENEIELTLIFTTEETVVELVLASS